jgi:hypothetical protein
LPIITLERYINDARTRLRSLPECDIETLRVRLAVVTRLAQHTLIEECVRLKVDLVEVASAVAYALLRRTARNERLSRDAPARKRDLTRARVARSRARARRDTATLASLEKIREALPGKPRDNATLFAHAALYQYLVRRHNYAEATRARRRELDGLMAAVLEACELGRTEDYAMLRRYRRALSRLRPGLFRIAAEPHL